MGINADTMSLVTASESEVTLRAWWNSVTLLTGTKQKTAISGIAIGVDRSHLAFRGFLPRKTTPREVYEATVIRNRLKSVLQLL
jgi:hypothetical protein